MLEKRKELKGKTARPVKKRNSCPVLSKYLNKLMELALHYKGYDKTSLCGYANSDRGNDVNDLKSTSGYHLKVFGNTVLLVKQETEPYREVIFWSLLCLLIFLDL